MIQRLLRFITFCADYNIFALLDLKQHQLDRTFCTGGLTTIDQLDMATEFFHQFGHLSGWPGVQAFNNTHGGASFNHGAVGILECVECS